MDTPLHAEGIRQTIAGSEAVRLFEGRMKTKDILDLVDDPRFIQGISVRSVFDASVLVLPHAEEVTDEIRFCQESE